MARVNIIMSVYNQEEYVKESIDSVLNQTFTDFCLLVINDGSTDASEELIRSFTDGRIRYISNEGNKGLIYSLNLGIELSLKSDCQYIARIDSDDLCYPERLATQVNYLDKNQNIGLLGGAMQFFGVGIKTQNKYAPVSQQKILSTFFAYNSFYHPTVIFRKDIVLEKRYSQNFPKYEDYGLWIDLIGTTGFHNLQDMAVRYRRHNTSVTATYKDNFIEDQKVFIRILNHLSDKLKIDLNAREITILSLITTTNRARIDGSITISELAATIDGVCSKCGNVDLDHSYLRQILLERCILYLLTNGRKADVFKLIYALKAFKESFFITIANLSGRKY